MRKITQRLTFLLMALFCLVGIKAQETITLSGDISQELDPGVTYSFYDSGGPSANYGNSQTYTATFTASGKITINFSKLVTESSSSCYNWDYMLIYDGDATTGTLIGRAQTGCSTAIITTNVDYEAESGTLTVEWHSDSSTNAEGWEATIVAEGAASDCAKPTSLQILPTLTATSATFSWTAGGEETQWQYLCIPAADAVDWDQSETTDENPLLVEELEPQTAYKFYLRAYCGDEEGQQSRVVSVAFTTPCEVITTLPKSFDFEDTDALACWTVGNLQSPTSTSYIPSRSSSAKHNGSYGLELKAYRYYAYSGSSSNTLADSAYAALPLINWGANGIQKHTMSFYAKSVSSTNKYNQHLYVYATDNLSSFTLLKDIELTTSFEQYEVDFRNYVGLGRYVVFFATIPAEHSDTYTGYYGHFYIDDIEVFETPACLPLKSISISDVERRSFKVTLTPKDGVALGTYDLVCSDVALDNDALEIASKTVVSAASHVVSGLERETKYYVYVRANCDADGVSTWVCDSARTKSLTTCEGVIGDGTSSAKYPFTNYDYSYSQTIYTANNFTTGGIINSLYLQRASGSAQMNNIKVYLGTTDKAVFASSSDWIAESDLTLVFEGSIAAGAGGVGEDEIIFDTPYAYDKQSNLVLAISNGVGEYGDIHQYYYTTATSGTYLHRQKDDDSSYANHPGTTSGTLDAYRANVRFGLCDTPAACPAVENLAANILGAGATEEKISWTASAADFLSGYEFILSDTAIVAFSEEELAKKESLAADVVEKDLNGLTPETEYFVYLRAVCKAESHDEGESDWASVNFTTLANCPKVKDLDAALVGLNKVEIFWDVANEEQDTTFYYVLSDVQLDGAGIAAATRIQADSLHVIIDALDYDQDYWAYVASKCGASVSDYDTVHFKTLASCQAVVDLQATRIAHNLVELNWAKAVYATEAQWEVGIIGDESKKQIVSEPKARIFGLDSETSYEAYVIALCSEFDHSDSTKVSFVTVEDPGNCQTIGTGSSTSYYAPFNTYNNNGWSQIIYPASEISGSGNIQAIAFYCNTIDATKDLSGTVAVYMAHTDLTTSSAWVPEADLQLVYQTTAFAKPTVTGWFEIALQTPFNYDGSSNIAVVVSSKLNDWSMTQNFRCTSVTNAVRYTGSDSSTSGGDYPTGSGTNKSDRPNIQFCFEAKACPDVKALAVSDITKESAHISWEPIGSEVQWNVFLSDTLVEDFSAITSTVIGKLDTVFSGLSDDADYYAYVQPVCVGADSWAHKGFRTIASCLAQKDLGIAHEADSITAHTAKLVWTDPNAVHAGDYTVAYGLKDSIDFDKPASYQTLASSDTFALIGNLIPETEYQFAVKANCGGGDESRYSELSAAFKTAIGCFKPSSDPSVPDSTITATTAIVHWADEHDAPAYKVAYGLYDEFDINDENKRIIVDATDTFKLIEGLQPNTRYKVMVKSNCGDYDGESSWTWSEDFYTHCLAAELPFNEGFESAEEFRCWTVGNLQSSSYTYIPYCNSDGKLQLYACKSSGINADSAYAVLPELNFGESALSQYSLALYADAYGAADSYNKHLYVGIVESPNDMSTFVQVGDLQVTTTTKRFEINLSSYSGSGRYIVLLAVVADGTGTRYGRFYIDDIEVFKTPTCYPLKSMSFSEVERRSFKVTLSPIDGHDLVAAHDLVCSTERLDEAGLEAAVKGTIAGADSVFSGLTRDTKYYIYARANCGGEDGVSAWIEDSVKTKALQACDDVQIGLGTSSTSYSPVYTYLTGYSSYTQQLYVMAAGDAAEISAISFEHLGTSSADMTVSNYKIYMANTTQSSLSSWVNSGLTEVFSGTTTFTRGNWTTINLDTPFAWDGSSNILVALYIPTAPGLEDSYFYGTSVSGQVLTATSNGTAIAIDATTHVPTTSPSSRSILPNVKFSFCYSVAACPTVDGLSYELVGDGTSEAIVRWNHPDVDYFGSYDVILSETEITDFSGAVATHSADKDSIKLLGLNASTDYYVYVRTICDGDGHDDGQSSWSDGVHFRTLAACPAPVAPVATLKAADSVFVEWGISFVDQAKAFQYYLSDEELTEAQILAINGLLPLNDTLSIGIGNLNPATDYHFYIRSICGGDYSPFAEAEFSTPVSCQKIVNLHSTNIAHNIIEVAWESAQFATETQWEVGIVGQEADAQVVSERSAQIFGLTPETAYQVYIKAICSATESSDAEIADFTTAAAPGDCQTIGTGSSSSYGPVCGYYGYERNGYIFTPVDGLSAGKILSIAWHYTGASTVPAKIYLKNTTETSFVTSVSWNSLVGDATLVYDASLTTSSGWVEIDITDFDYTGDNLMVLVASSYGGNGGGTSYAYNTTNSGNASCHVYAKKDNSMDDDALISSFSSNGVNGERHNIQFCFAGDPTACRDVDNLAASDEETHSAKISWTPMGSETAWRIILSDTAVVDFDAIAAVDIDTAYVLSYAFSGLDADKAYHAYVQPLCGGSDWSHVSFTTMPSCYAPTNLVAELNAAGNIDVTWQAGHGETEFQVVCVRSGEPVWDGVAAVSALAVELDTLTVGEDYTVYVRAYCSATDASQAVSAAFTYDYCKPAPISVDKNGIIAIEFNGVEQTEAVHPTSQPYYKDNTNVIFEVEVGATAKASITYKTYYNYGTIVWVDLNKNLKFEEFEVVFKGTAPQAGSSSAPEPSIIDCEFTVPAIVPTGTYRLRIGGADSFFDNFIGGGAYSDELSCSSGGYRIYEDYTLVIKPASGPGTALDNVSVDADGVQKILLNDHLFIIREGVWYDAAGRRVEVKR
jgi:hypothetical protein